MNATADLFVHFIGDKEPTLYQSGMSNTDAETKAKDINHWKRARYPTPHAPTTRGVIEASVTTVTIVHARGGAS